jgi:hypothetical protein
MAVRQVDVESLTTKGIDENLAAKLTGKDSEEAVV